MAHLRGNPIQLTTPLPGRAVKVCAHTDYNLCSLPGLCGTEVHSKSTECGGDVCGASVPTVGQLETSTRDYNAIPSGALVCDMWGRSQHVGRRSCPTACPGGHSQPARSFHWNHPNPQLRGGTHRGVAGPRGAWQGPQGRGGTHRGVAGLLSEALHPQTSQPQWLLCVQCRRGRGLTLGVPSAPWAGVGWSDGAPGWPAQRLEGHASAQQKVGRRASDRLSAGCGADGHGRGRPPAARGSSTGSCPPRRRLAAARPPARSGRRAAPSRKTRRSWEGKDKDDRPAEDTLGQTPPVTGEGGRKCCCVRTASHGLLGEVSK